MLDDTLLDADSRDIPATGQLIITIGKDLGKSQCDVCQFFFGHSPKYKRKYNLQVRLFDRIHGLHLPAPAPAPKRFLSVIRQNKRAVYDHSMKDEIVEQGVVIFAPREDSTIPSILPLNPTTINYQHLESSVLHCKESHHSCRKTLGRNYDLPYINLIDCHTHRVIRGNLGMEYFALSYVWGPAAKSRQQEEEFSLESAPSTVRDAIQVVRNLGMQYLWVDRYCINQNDHEEKELMIGRMDQIYESGEATIVAADGENDEAGLPGVSVTRIPQSHLRTPRWHFVSSCPPISTVINSAVWATRGWTYQEARLSRRCLFFTEHQVYMVCRHRTYSESLHLRFTEDWVLALLNSGHLGQDLFGPRLAGLVGALFRDRFNFCQRQLTDENDILNAFRGILRRSPFVSFWGVPIIPLPAKMDANIGFALGLLWRRRPSWSVEPHLVRGSSLSLATRRVDFPTWSWASVTGEIFNDGYGEQSIFGSYLNGLTKESGLSDANLRFWLMVGGNYLPLNDVVSNYRYRLIPEGKDSQQLLVEGDIVRLRRTPHGAHRVYDCEHLDLTLFMSLDLEHLPGAEHPVELFEDALILVNWNDDQKLTQRRFVMMLLEWVEEGVAERRGLVSDYRTEHSATIISQIPTSRKTFRLK
jgi:hypothetical protein